jgi:hypothetical protein
MEPTDSFPIRLRLKAVRYDRQAIMEEQVIECLIL